MRTVIRVALIGVLAMPGVAWATCQQPYSLPKTGESPASLSYCPPLLPEPPPAPPTHDAQYVGVVVPGTMVAGQSYAVSVLMKNTGTEAWSSASGIHLGGENPVGNTRWNVWRVPVAGTIAPGQVATIGFTVQAPANAGTHAFQWRMLQDGVAWFGALSQDMPVAVHAGSITASPNPCTIAAGASTCTTTVTWSSSAADTEVWVSNLDGSNPAMMTRAQNGTTAPPWISANPLRFHLKIGGFNGPALATADVYGQHAVPPKPRVSLTRHYLYDAHQQLCKSIEPETGATVRAYDGAGNLAWSAAGLALPGTSTCDTAHPDVAARKVTRTWDARNRISALRFPDGLGDTDHAYMADGRLATLRTDNGGGDVVVSTYAWNRRGLLTAEQMTLGATAWQLRYDYDANGHVAGLVYPDGLPVSLAPNALGQPTRAGGYATGVAYHPNGLVKQFTYGNGFVHTASFNGRRMPEVRRDAHGTSGVVVLDDAYDYDPNHNIAAISDALPGHRGDRTMGHDALDRLSWVTSPMFTSANYSYDGLDNIVHASIGGTAARSQAFCYDATWRLTNLKTGTCSSGASVVGMGYDAQGNVSNKNGVAYTFDYGNRLRSVGGQPGSKYVYDGHGRRVRDTTSGDKESYYNHAGQLAYTRDARAGVASHYVYLGDRLVAVQEAPESGGSAVVKYQHTDVLGSPVAVTDASGAVIERTEYEPFGRVLNRVGADGPGFTGHVFDSATGLNYSQQRYFDPMLMRFPSVDAVTAYGSGDHRHFNPYAYGFNNPYRYKDPDGRAAHVAIGAGVGAVFSGGIELYRQVRSGDGVSWKHVAIETGKGAVVGALTAAVPGSGLAFGGVVTRSAVTAGNAVSVGAAGEVGAQFAKGEAIDMDAALAEGVANGVGLIGGIGAAPLSKVLTTIKIPAVPGVAVWSTPGRSFLIGHIPAQTIEHPLHAQALQDSVGEGAASIVEIFNDSN